MMEKGFLVLCLTVMWVQIRSEHEIRRRSDDPNQVEIMVQQQAKALQELTAEVAALKTDLAATKQQKWQPSKLTLEPPNSRSGSPQNRPCSHKTAEVAALKTDLAATKQQKWQPSKQTLQPSKQTLQPSKQTLQPQNSSKTKLVVAFTVRFSAKEVQVAPKGVFHFDVVPYNIGNGYSTHSGIFTAPYSGVYVFIVNIMITNDETFMQVAIDKSGTPLAETHADSKNSDLWNKGMTHVTVHLTEGEQVWVRQNEGDTGVYGGWWTSFTGFLLHAD